MTGSIKREVLITTVAREALETWQRELIEKAEEAAANAYAPYSNFHVGAALLTEKGRIVQGNNQENSAYPSGLCAERVAVFAARAQFPDEKIKAIVVTARKKESEHFIAVTPCGSCRQVLSEVEDQQQAPIVLMMTSTNDEVYVSESIENLLPFKFSNKYLS